MADITPPPAKRFRSSQACGDPPTSPHEWMNRSPAEAAGKEREDAEPEPVTSNSFRIEDLDDRLKMILAGITSKRPSDGLIEFRKLLQSDRDGHLLFQYVLLSPKFAELMSVWALGPSCEAAVPLLHLMTELMKHPMGIQIHSPDLSTQEIVKRHSVVVRSRIDKLARSIVLTKLKDMYTHLTSAERSRQRAALLLMASIVKRGSSLASDVSANFDFSLNALPKLAKPYKSSQEKKQSGRFRPVRSAFIEFALSFLEVSHAALLRWILQIRPLYTGVLHKLAMDDENTILSVLKVFRATVLDPASMVPPGLQSALFGDAALEQLAIISSEASHLEAAQAAHDMLLLICSDPSHGICPEPSFLWETSTRKAGTFGGGQGRLLRLMLKLRATENQNHRELLLSTAAGNPMLVSAYFDSFPYSLEPRASVSWFAAVCLISDIVLVAKAQPPFLALATQGLPPPSFDTAVCQAILGSALPQNCTRLVINRGLLHANISVRHGCVRVLLEVLSAVEFYMVSIQKSRATCHRKLCFGKNKEPGQELLPENSENCDTFSSSEDTQKHTSECERWAALERNLINELRSFLPDPQVLISMVVAKSATTSHCSQDKFEFLPLTDIIDVPSTIDENLSEVDTNDLVQDEEANLMEVWNADSQLVQTGDLKDIRGFLNAKLLEVLGFYQRMIPTALVECSFDVFKLIPEEPTLMSVSQQKALLMLLLAASGEIQGSNSETLYHTTHENVQPRHLYRHLKSLLKFMLKPKAGCIKEQARILAYRAMNSCGAFENNASEIGLWLEFLPVSDDAVVSFFCDAVDTIGRNSDKYADMLLSIIQSSSDVLTTSNFGSLGICVLDKCLRVVASNTKKFNVPQKTSIAIYTVNALHLLLQSQVHPKTLCTILNLFLCMEKHDSLLQHRVYRSELYPLQNLRLEISQVLETENVLIWDLSLCSMPAQKGRFQEVLEFCKSDDRSSLEVKVSALNSCLTCVHPEEIVENFPLLMELLFPLFQGKIPVLTQLFGVHKWLLPSIMQSWKDLFNKSLVIASSFAHHRNAGTDAVHICQNDLDKNESSSAVGGEGNDMGHIPVNVDIVRSFSEFLLGLPFGIIFPAAVGTRKAKLLKKKPFAAILDAAISRLPPELWLSSANSILFWIDGLWKHQCQGSDVNRQLKTCFSLLKLMIVPVEGRGWFSLLEHSVKRSTNLNLVLEFIRGVIAHLIMDLRHQIRETKNSTRIETEEPQNKYIVSAIESWFETGRNVMTFLDGSVVDILKEALQQIADTSCKSNEGSEGALNSVMNTVLMCCSPFLTESLETLKEAVVNRKTSATTEISLHRAAYVVLHFSSYINIDLIVDLSCTLFSLETAKDDVNAASLSSLRVVYLELAIFLATSAFERIGQWIQQKALIKSELLNGRLLQRLYRNILQLALTKPSEKLFSCLLSALDANYGSHFMHSDGFLCPSFPVYFSVCIHNTPVGILHHLMIKINRTKAKIIFYLVQASQIFLAEFLKELCQYLELLELGSAASDANVNGMCNGMILILPAVNWVLNVAKYREINFCSMPMDQIAVSYYELITNVSERWDIFPTTLDITEILPFINSPSDFSKLFLSTTAGQLVLMLRHCLANHSYNMEEKKKLFALMSQNGGFISDSSIQNMNKLAIEGTVKLVSIAIAKSMLAKMLVVPNANTCPSDMKAGPGSPTISDEMTERAEETGDCFCELVEMSIQTLNMIFKQRFECTEGKEYEVLEISGNKIQLSKKDLFDVLERSLLRDLKDVFKMSADYDQRPKLLPLLKRLTKMILRYRFGEKMLMQVLRYCVSVMSQTPGFLSSYATYAIELLVGHSEFVPTLLFSNDTQRHFLLRQYFHEKESCTRSLSSVLYLLRSPLKEQSSKACDLTENGITYSTEMKLTDAECKKLGLLKFMRLLYSLKHQDLQKVASSDETVKSVEILSLLLAAYNASLNEVDKEILLLMQEIESLEGSGFPGISGMDYLWGEAAIKRLKTPVSNSADSDTVKVVWKRSIKEDLMLEPLKCALGVLFFPPQRKLLSGTPFSSEPCDEENHQFVRGGVETLLTDAAYDPCFMLPFTLHTLSCGWMSPEDFVRKGLLALTLVSISSADEDMRKLGYGILSKYFTVLETCESFKGKLQIRLLLTFVKNMVIESWQRFPFIVALFAAEASYVLMNPSDIHYPAINKFLLHAPGVDIEMIPLFKPLFGSGSVHFRADRAWILRLLAFGLRTSFDTHIYRRRFVLEVLMSFYSSSLADKHTREWILQLLLRTSKLRSLVQYLVEQAGLLSWLSTIICSNGTAKSGEYATGTCDDFTLAAVQVLENTLSWRSVKRWIISEGFEELAKAVWLLHCALIKNTSFKEEVKFMKPYLRILRAAFNLSLARKKYQSRLRFSIGDILGIVHFMKKHKDVMSVEMQLFALETILEGTPSACSSFEEKLHLYEFGTWAFGVVQFDYPLSPFLAVNIQRRQTKKPDAAENSSSFDVDGLVERLLRWVTAALLLGGLEQGILSKNATTTWGFLKNAIITANTQVPEHTHIKDGLLELLINLHYSPRSTWRSSTSSVVCACMMLLLRGSAEKKGFFLRRIEDILEGPFSQISVPGEADIYWRWKPSASGESRSTFEYEICSMLVSFFLQLLHVEEEENGIIHHIVERLQVAYKDRLDSRGTSSERVVRS